MQIIFFIFNNLNLKAEINHFKCVHSCHVVMKINFIININSYLFYILPQFINSLVGDISIVGPRPALPRETAAYSSLYERRLLVKPGITGPWQISGRSDLDLKTSIALDLNYVVNWSFMGDLFIIINTPAAILGKKGAY